MSNIKAQSNNILILQKFILDPLSTVIKLAVLGKKEIGCKISIKNNQIYIQENGIFQGVARYYLRVTKNDIHYLSIPIELACKRYITLEKIKDIPNILTIFKCAQQGLNNLMETYNMFPIIIHCLKYYYSIIDKYLHLIACEKLNSSLLLENQINILPKSIYNKIEVLPQKSSINKIDDLQTKPIKIPNKPKNKETKSPSGSPNDYHTPILNNEFLSDPNNNVEDIAEIKTKELEENNDESKEIDTEPKTDEVELLLLYTDEILNKFDLIWDKSKIQIVIDMINYLSSEKSAFQYAGCIETFMIPIDKEIIKITEVI
jgi:hypothetical protein